MKISKLRKLCTDKSEKNNTTTLHQQRQLIRSIDLLFSQDTRRLVNQMQTKQRGSFLQESGVKDRRNLNLYKHIQNSNPINVTYIYISIYIIQSCDNAKPMVPLRKVGGGCFRTAKLINISIIYGLSHNHTQPSICRPSWKRKANFNCTSFPTSFALGYCPVRLH